MSFKKNIRLRHEVSRRNYGLLNAFGFVVKLVFVTVPNWVKRIVSGSRVKCNERFI